MKDIKINEVIKEMNLGDKILEIIPITGGLLHSMYEVKTEVGKYAIKRLNPCIMARKEAMGNYINSEKIACALENKIPVVLALKKNEKAIIELEGDFYMIFPWQEGKSIFNPYITNRHCEKMGEIIGKIHSTNLAYLNIPKERQDKQVYDWERYVKLAKDNKVIWAGMASEMMLDLKKWEIISNKASQKLESEMILSHRDLDAKNVMWHKGEPYIIDWEAAGYVNPFQEFVEVINYWAQDEMGELVQDKFETIKSAYTQYMNLSGVDWKSVLESGYLGMLGWLNYNCRRSLGIESMTEEEKELGTEQVILTLKDLEKYQEKINKLLEWLLR